MKEESFEVGIKRHFYHAKMRKLREEAGMTQQDLARMLMVSPMEIHRIESLKMVPSESRAESIASILDVDTDWLFPEIFGRIVETAQGMQKEATVSVTRLSLESPDVLKIEESARMPGEADQKILSQKVIEMLEVLAPREKQILKMRFGISPFRHAHTMEDVGKDFRVSKARIREIEAKALNKLEKMNREKREEILTTWLPA